MYYNSPHAQMNTLPRPETNEQKNKRVLWRYGYVIGPVICLTVVTIDFAAAALMLAFPSLSDSVGKLIAELLFSLTLFFVPCFVIPKMLGRRLSRTVSAARLPADLFLALCAAALAAAMLCSVLTSTLTGIFEPPSIDIPEGVFGVIFWFVCSSALPALTEEFLARGVILGLLRPFGKPFAVVASSVIFALMHRNFAQIIPAVAFGLVLAFIAVKTGSIWPGVVVHFLNNLTACTVIFASENYGEQTSLVVNYISSIAIILVGLIGAFYLCVRYRTLFEFKEKNTVNTLPFFFSPGMIIFYVICLVQAFTAMVVSSL